MLEGADYEARVTNETRTYQDCLNVDNLPEIFHYWSNRYVRPSLQRFGFSSPDEMLLKYAREQCQANPGRHTQMLSIGAGNCDLEVEIARHLQAKDIRNFTIECVDLNQVMLERGRMLAGEHGVSQYLTFTPADINTWKPQRESHVAIACQFLHHVVELEHVLAQIRGSLTNDGVFLVADIIGRNGHQRWPEALAFVRQFWRRLPPSYRFNNLLQRFEERFEDWDCSVDSFEGIRAQDILPLLLRSFHFNLFVAYANLIDPFVDRAFGPNFDPASEWDRHFIDEVHKRDEAELQSGRIKPTQMLAVMSKQPQAETLYRGSLSPQFCLRDPSDKTDRQPPLDSEELPPYEATAWTDNIKANELTRVCRVLKLSDDQRRKVDSQLAKALSDYETLETHFEERTVWALTLEAEGQRLAAELSRARQLLADKEREIEERNAWALQLDKELETARQTHQGLEEQFNERTAWALRLDGEVAELKRLVSELNEEREHPSANDHRHTLKETIRRVLGPRKSH